MASKVTQVVSPLGGVQPAEMGIRKTAEELGILQPEVQRAHKIASLTDEAKETARERGLADNGSALLKAAAAPPAEQANVIRDIAEHKASRSWTGAKPSASSSMDDVSRELNSWRAAGEIAHALNRVFDANGLGSMRHWLKQTTISDILEQLDKLVGSASAPDTGEAFNEF